MPMIATTIISSIKVKPCWTRFMFDSPWRQGGLVPASRDAVAVPAVWGAERASARALVHGRYSLGAEFRQLRATPGDASRHYCITRTWLVDRDDLALRQGTNAMRAVLRRDLAHHRTHFARLDVRDQHVGGVLQPRQFLAEKCRAQMTAHAGELALFVAERGFDHQRRDAHAVQARPECGVRPGVAGEYERAALGHRRPQDGEPYRRYGVLGGQHFDAPLAQVDHLPHLERQQ